MSGELLYIVLFWLAAIYRYLRLVISTISFAVYRSTPPLDEEKNHLNTQDVTIVISCLDGDSAEIRKTVSKILENKPFQVILVTIEKNHGRALELAQSFDEKKKITVLSKAVANKRLQMLCGLQAVQTKFIVFSDDDVYWQPRTLAWLLAPFNDTSIGATGTSQRLRRATDPTISQRTWNFLAAAYLERRNFDCASCNAIDGGLPCLSGRTAMYRAEILDEDFQKAFQGEMWKGSKLNHADDDNFLTRWLVTKGWKTKMQYSEECEIETTLAEDRKFLLQCLRWSRSNWRSNITSLFDDQHVWRKHPWSTYAVFLTTITAWSLPWDIALLYLLHRGTESFTIHMRSMSLVAYATFWLLARSIKLSGHFRRYPIDILYLPLSISFGYFHCVAIKTWAMCTLNQTTWGSRSNADVDDAWRMLPSSPPPYSSSCGAHVKAGAAHPPRVHRSLNCHSVTAPLLD